MTQIIATFRLMGKDGYGKKTPEINEHELDNTTYEVMSDFLKDVVGKEMELISWGVIK